MVSAAGQIRNQRSCQGGPKEALDMGESIPDGYRLRRARIRILSQSAAGTTCTMIFYLLVFQMLGPAFAPYWRRTGLLLIVLIVLPLWIVGWRNWVQARRGIAELAEPAVGIMHPDGVQTIAVDALEQRRAVAHEPDHQLALRLHPGIH